MAPHAVAGDSIYGVEDSALAPATTGGDVINKKNKGFIVYPRVNSHELKKIEDLIHEHGGIIVYPRGSSHELKKIDEKPELDHLAEPHTLTYAHKPPKVLDDGLFLNQLQRYDIYPGSSSARAQTRGTFDATKRSFTHVFKRIEQKFEAFFDIINVESSLPWPLAGGTDTTGTHEERRRLFTWQATDPESEMPYPPHLKTVPPSDKFGALEIFDLSRLASTASLLLPLIPDEITDFFHDYDETNSTFKNIEADYHTRRGDGWDAHVVKTIGSRPEWYTDDLFAQQSFTGNSPATITLATKEHIEWFRAAAETAPNKTSVLDIMDGTGVLYVQDCSYYRRAIGLGPDDPIETASNLYQSTQGHPMMRYTPATLTLLHLGNDGKLHPLAITLDHKSTVAKSVTIFNRRLSTKHSTESEPEDWPWRYAKLCSQVSDWMRHELAVHLVSTHFVEEVTIVAANRAFEPTHAVFELLRPHWAKTLSLNASARSALVPKIIVQIAGVPPAATYNFINYTYEHFDWQKSYVPNDLAARGFPVEEVKRQNGLYHNYGYARNILLMWDTLRKFVMSVLVARGLDSDEAVRNDESLGTWSDEMHNSAKMPTFPDFRDSTATLDQLADAVTMCIHVAGPQHSAVNYLQEYYQSFVVNKPPALCSPLPQTLEELMLYTERDVVRALPISRPREWLLASHVPHLLSPHVLSADSLLTFAQTMATFTEQHLNEHKEAIRAAGERESEGERVKHRRELESQVGVLRAAEGLWNDLVSMGEMSTQFESEFDDKGLKYDVLQPRWVASSLII